MPVSDYSRPVDRIFDLPAHPLLVHFPVVAIPVLAIAAVALIARPSLRPSLDLPLVALAVATTIATFLAARSGEALRDDLEADEYIETHQNLGSQLTWIVLVLTLALVGFVLWTRRRSASPRFVNGAGLLIVLLASLALIWVVRTGHEGAKATWKGVLPEDDAALVSTAGSVDEPTGTTSTAAPTTTTTEAATTTAAEATTTTEATTTEAPATTDAAAVDGMAIYEANCQRCHRADGSGGRGPSLLGIAAEQPDPQEQIDQVISGGRGMPAFGERLTPAEIEAVVDYIRTTFG